jgi:O-antigen/teichoic acid export membrane protein
MNPLFPALSRSAREPEIIRRTVAKTARIVLLLVVPLCAGTIVVSPSLPALLGWPADFANASPLMAILSLQLPVIALDMILGSVLMAIGLQGRWVVVGIIAAVLKVGLNFAAIPIFENLTGNGAIGASIVTLLAEIWMFFGALVLIPKELLDVRIARDIAWIFLAGTAATVAGSILLHVGLVPAVVGSAVAYLVLVVSLRALTTEDLRPLTSRVTAVLGRRSANRHR